MLKLLGDDVLTLVTDTNGATIGMLDADNKLIAGKRIERIVWPDTESEKDRIMDMEDGTIAVYKDGDRENDLPWIIIYEEGVETTRYNPRYVEAICWLDEK